MSTPRALRPLRNPAYRWLAAALVASMVGAGIWIVALVWQIVAIGGGAAELSLVAGASAVGMLLTTLLGGALADRMSQKRILFVVEVVRAASVGVVAMLSLSGGLAAWQLADDRRADEPGRPGDEDLHGRLLGVADVSH